MGKAAKPVSKGGAPAAGAVFQTGLPDVEPWPHVENYQKDESENTDSTVEVKLNGTNDDTFQHDSNKGSTSLREWGKHTEDEEMPLVVSKIKGYDSKTCKWVSLSEYCTESVLGNVGDDGQSTDKWDIRRMKAGSLEFRSSLQILSSGTIDFSQRFPWLRVEEREPRTVQGTDKSEGATLEKKQRIFAVQVYFDGRLREILVDDLVPMDGDKILLAHEIVEVPADDEVEEVNEKNKQENVKAETSKGGKGKPKQNEKEEKQDKEAEEEKPVKKEPRAPRFKTIMWCTLLEKAIVWAQNEFGGKAGKTHPLVLLGPCVSLEGEMTNLDLGKFSPKESDWAHLRVPQESDFVFPSWDEWMRAKAEAKNSHDEDALAILEGAGEAAKEKKKLHLAAKYAAADAPQVEGTTEEQQHQAKEKEKKKREKEKKSKRKKKGKKSRDSEDEFLPLNIAAFETAVTQHKTALAEAIRNHRPLCKNFELLRASGKARARICLSRGKVPLLPEDAEPLDPEDQNLRQKILSLAMGKWEEVEVEFRPNFLYYIAEVGDQRVRLVGEPKIVSKGTLETFPSRTQQTFWIQRKDLLAIQAQIDVWQCFNPEQDACRILYDCNQPAEDNYPKDCGYALILPPTGVNQSLENLPHEASFTLVLSRSGPLKNAHAKLQIATFMSGFVAIEQDIMRCFENIGSKTTGQCPEGVDVKTYHINLAAGITCYRINLSLNAIHAYALDASHDLNIHLVGIDPLENMVPRSLPVLDAWKVIRDHVGGSGDSAERFLKNEIIDLPRVKPKDWQCIARYRVMMNKGEESEESSEDTVSLTKPCCATVEFQNPAHREFLQIWEINNETGTHYRRDSCGMWMAPVYKQNRVVDLMFVLVNSGDEGIIPPVTCKLSLASLSGFEKLERLSTSTSELFEGEYIGNNKRLMFREYFEVIPEVLSLRVDMKNDQVPFKVQLISQDVEAQLATCKLGTDADELIAEYSSENLACGSLPGVVELHTIPSQVREQVRASPTRRLVIQGIIMDESFFSRPPYWATKQFPKNYENEQCNQNQNPKSVLFQIRAIASEPLILKRETTWETALLRIQADWEAEHPGRAEKGRVLREGFRTGFFDALPAILMEESNKPPEKGSKQQPPEVDKLAGAQEARLAARKRLSTKMDKNGNVFWRRCPVPANDEDEFILDEYQNRQESIIFDEEYLQKRRSQRAEWYQQYSTRTESKSEIS